MDRKTSLDLSAKYYHEKKFSKALFYLNKINRSEPRNTSVLLKMASCYFGLGDDRNTINIIERVLKIDKNNDKLYYDLSVIYKRIGDIEGTIKACERAIEINPRVLSYYLALADVYEKTNELERTLEILFQGLLKFPDSAPLQILAAKSQRRLGKFKESYNRLESLSAQETNLPSAWKVEYNFELGFIHDKQNNADLAFHHFTKANDLTRALPSYQRVDANHSLELIHNLGNLDYGKIKQIIEISKRKPPKVQPVFFVGFPRSGTTLVQKVLDSHHKINVIEENNPLGRVTSLIERTPEKYLESSFLLNIKNIEDLRGMYFNEARKYVPDLDGGLLVDKLPMNIVQVPIIKILFPDAKILLGLRHPCDSILSCFMQNFGVNRAMANMFEFKSIINFYDKTMGLWKIFRNEIDFETQSIRYEDLIENMEGEIRQLLKFLDLSWDEEVLNYRQNVFNRGIINTPSYSQVVKPIYKEARYRWHRYAKYFEPYIEQLEPHCEMFGYSLEVSKPLNS